MTTISKPFQEYGFPSMKDEAQFFRSAADAVTENGPKQSTSKQLKHRSNDFRRKGNEDLLAAAECREAAEAHRRANNSIAATHAHERAESFSARAASRIKRSDALHCEAMRSRTVKDRLKKFGLHIFVGANTLSVVVGLLCTPMQNKQIDEIDKNVGALIRAKKHEMQTQQTVAPTTFSGPLSYIV